MINATIRPLDIVDVKAGIRAGRLFVQIKDNRLLLVDFQTGEAVSLSDIEVKAVVHGEFVRLPEEVIPCLRVNPMLCKTCNTTFFTFNKEGKRHMLCPYCGAQMDGDSGAEP